MPSPILVALRQERFLPTDRWEDIVLDLDGLAARGKVVFAPIRQLVEAGGRVPQTLLGLHREATVGAHFKI